MPVSTRPSTARPITTRTTHRSARLTVGSVGTPRPRSRRFGQVRRASCRPLVLPAARPVRRSTQTSSTADSTWRRRDHRHQVRPAAVVQPAGEAAAGESGHALERREDAVRRRQTRVRHEVGDQRLDRGVQDAGGGAPEQHAGEHDAEGGREGQQGYGGHHRRQHEQHPAAHPVVGEAGAQRGDRLDAHRGGVHHRHRRRGQQPVVDQVERDDPERHQPQGARRRTRSRTRRTPAAADPSHRARVDGTRREPSAVTARPWEGEDAGVGHLGADPRPAAPGRRRPGRPAPRGPARGGR